MWQFSNGKNLLSYNRPMCAVTFCMMCVFTLLDIYILSWIIISQRFNSIAFDRMEITRTFFSSFMCCFECVLFFYDPMNSFSGSIFFEFYNWIVVSKIDPKFFCMGVLFLFNFYMKSIKYFAISHCQIPNRI